MHRLRLLLTAAVMAIFAALGVAAPANGAVDYFLEIEGIPGESRDARLVDTIDVQSYSWGASRTNKAQLHDFNVTKHLDLASPALFRALAQGTTIGSAELIGRKAGEQVQPFLRYCLQGVRVTSLQQSDSRGADSPLEQVSFSYAAFSEQYAVQNADGTLGQTVFGGWNSTTGLLISSYPANCGGPL